MTRPQVTVTVEANEGGEVLRSYVTALLLPLVSTCDVHIHVSHRSRTENP